MAHIKRKYIDSHWLVFIFQGAIALIFGSATLFTSHESPRNLIPLVGVYLLALAVVEFANTIYRSSRSEGWFVSLLVALFDAACGLLLLFISNSEIRGFFEILIGFRTTVDPTDRFIWVLCGICGMIFGFVIFNSGHLPNIDFLRFFGAYMLILGISSLDYGVHNRVQKLEDREARSLAAKESKRKNPKTSKRR